MNFLTIEQIKIQCRLELDDTSQDSQLAMLGDVAEQAVADHLNRTLYPDAVPEDEANGLVVNPPVRMAMLLMVGQLYENREATSDLSLKEVPLAYQYLLAPYRVIPL